MKGKLRSQIKNWGILGMVTLAVFMAALCSGMSARAAGIPEGMNYFWEDYIDGQYYVINVSQNENTWAYVDLDIKLEDGNGNLLHEWYFGKTDIPKGNSYFPLLVCDFGSYSLSNRFHLSADYYDCNGNFVCHSGGYMPGPNRIVFLDFNGATDEENRGYVKKSAASNMPGENQGKACLTNVMPQRKGYKFIEWNTEKDGTGYSYKPGDWVGLYSDYRKTLYAQWEKVEYKLSYNTLGGTSTPATQYTTYNNEIKISETIPVREGYIFKGWKYSYNEQNKIYQPGEKIQVSRDITLVAVWEIKKYTIKYDGGQGISVPATETVNYGHTYVVSRTKPLKTGSYFVNWNDKQDGTGKSYAPGDVISVNGNLTLYAQWKLNKYLIEYFANGGDSVPAVQIKTYGVDLALTNMLPTRTGYTCVEWNTKADRTGTAYKSGAVLKSNSDVNLYAIWKRNEYTIKYDAMGGSGAPSGFIKLYGQNTTLSKTQPTKTGYIFIAWNEKQDGTGKSYAPGATITANSNLTLYAQWKYSENPFADVATNHWSYESVKYMYERNIMSGKGLDKNKKVIFAPTANTTRAEAVMVIYNMAKKPKVTYQSVFSDVKAGQWYSEAVIWAYQNKITAGYGKKFGVDDKITREQMAVMLYSYAKLKKYTITTNAKAVDSFPDRNKISSWAKDAMVWAVSNGIINGNGKNLNPTGNATREELAAMLKNFLEHYEK